MPLFLSPIYHSWPKIRIFRQPQNLVFSPRPQRFHFLIISVPLPFEEISFLLTFSSYCECSSFVVRAVLNFSMNAMARSAESFTAARTWSLVWPALKCDSLSQVEAGCWTKVSLIPSTGNTSFVLEVTTFSFLWRNQWWFPLQALQKFTQGQLGVGFSRILCFFFLLPNRSESHRSTRGVVSWLFVLAWRHQQQRHPTLSALLLGHARTQHLHALLALL